MDDVVDLVSLEAENLGKPPSNLIQKDHRFQRGAPSRPLAGKRR